MNERLAWLVDNTWDLRWYVVVLVIGFGLGIYFQPKTVCLPYEPSAPYMGEVVKTFYKVGDEDLVNMTSVVGLCEEDGKPIIRMFSTEWCPHCTWASPVFEEVARENADKAIFRHWDVDTGDDLLTIGIESAMSMGDYMLYDQFSGGSIPAYVFGCQYYRIGNIYEQQDDLASEKQSFIDGLEMVLRNRGLDAVENLFEGKVSVEIVGNESLVGK